MFTRALIADDHPLFRAAMRQALGVMSEGGVEEASSIDEALSVLEQDDDIELIFLDVNMPGNEGLIGLSEIRSIHPGVLVVIVSAYDDSMLVRKAMDLGASAYIPKSSSIELITQAVEKVLDGEQWLPDSLNDALPEYSSPEQQQVIERLNSLTPHQLKVLKMLANGLLNKQIAYELDISESTVKQHVSQVLKKLGVINRTKAGVIFRQLMDVDSDVPANKKNQEKY